MTLSWAIIGIEGMRCSSCSNKIQSKISEKSGVHNVTVSIRRYSVSRVLKIVDLLVTFTDVISIT